MVPIRRIFVNEFVVSFVPGALNSAMRPPDDMHLWKLVKETIAPLAQPRPQATLVQARPVQHVTTLDLHGMTVQQAYQTTLAFIISAAQHKVSRVTVITGRSGQIRAEFRFWVEHHPKVRQIAALNGGGAFSLKIRL